MTLLLFSNNACTVVGMGLPDYHEDADVALVFRPVPNFGVPAAIRLRRLLKYALRSCGFRAIDHRQVKPADEPIIVNRAT
jgi:hypothetical protein